MRSSSNAAKPKAFTSRGNDWSKRFDYLLSELVMLPTRECIIDGEAVVQDEKGLTDFGALQDDLAKDGSDRIVYFAFDLLYLDGHDLRRTPLRERKRLLSDLMGGHGRRLQLSEHEESSGAAMFKRACQVGTEGIVSKRADAPPSTFATMSTVGTRTSGPSGTGGRFTVPTSRLFSNESAAAPCASTSIDVNGFTVNVVFASGTSSSIEQVGFWPVTTFATAFKQSVTTSGSLSKAH